MTFGCDLRNRKIFLLFYDSDGKLAKVFFLRPRPFFGPLEFQNYCLEIMFNILRYQLIKDLDVKSDYSVFF